MLDTSRHYIPVHDILRTLRGMSFVKMNILHWHIVDAQSFPLDIGPFTHKISSNGGAYSSSEIYNLKDITKIIEYARLNGIMIMPEIDTPGHVYCWRKGFPEVITCDGLEYQTTLTCPQPPCGFLDLKEKFNAATNVVKHIFEETIDAFKIGQIGYCTFLHLGFDEVTCKVNNKTKKCHKPGCNAAYKKYSEKYANWIYNVWYPKIKKHLPNFKLMQWIDQILHSNFDSKKYLDNPPIKFNSKNIVFQFWNTNEETPYQLQVLQNFGVTFIQSDAKDYYLDCGQSSWLWGGKTISRNFLDKKANQFNGLFWCKALTNDSSKGYRVAWEDIYMKNPLTVTTLIEKNDIPEEEVENQSEKRLNKVILLKQTKSIGSKGGVLGASANLWTEAVDKTILDSMLWPRLSAHSEALWRFNKNRPPDNLINARYRLALHREDLIHLGINAKAIIPQDGIFTKMPHGPIGSSTHPMTNINIKQQYPQGTLFRYVCNSPWCTWCDGKSENIFCPKGGNKFKCNSKKGDDYINQGCLSI